MSEAAVVVGLLAGTMAVGAVWLRALDWWTEVLYAVREVR